MKILDIKKVFAVLIALAILIPAAAPKASEYRFILGVISADEGKELIVNENTRVVVRRETKVYNSRGKEISVHSLRGHKWIYVEGPVDEDSSVIAESIYLLPGYVNNKAKKRYPFIKSR